MKIWKSPTVVNYYEVTVSGTFASRAYKLIPIFSANGRCQAEPRREFYTNDMEVN